jgi:hypothetical protein
MFAVGFGSAISDYETSPSTTQHFAPTADYPNGEIVNWNPHGWEIAIFVVGLIVGLFGLVCLFGWFNNRFARRATRAERIDRLSSALKEALETIGAIQAEVEQGQKTLEKLESEIAANQGLAQLTETEASAVKEILRGEFRRERMPAIRVQLALGLIFFGLGLAASAIFHI